MAHYVNGPLLTLYCAQDTHGEKICEEIIMFLSKMGKKVVSPRRTGSDFSFIPSFMSNTPKASEKKGEIEFKSEAVWSSGGSKEKAAQFFSEK